MRPARSAATPSTIVRRTGASSPQSVRPVSARWTGSARAGRMRAQRPVRPRNRAEKSGAPPLQLHTCHPADVVAEPHMAVVNGRAVDDGIGVSQLNLLDHLPGL